MNTNVHTNSAFAATNSLHKNCETFSKVQICGGFEFLHGLVSFGAIQLQYLAKSSRFLLSLNLNSTLGGAIQLILSVWLCLDGQILSQIHEIFPNNTHKP